MSTNNFEDIQYVNLICVIQMVAEMFSAPGCFQAGKSELYVVKVQNTLSASAPSFYARTCRRIRHVDGLG